MSKGVRRKTILGFADCTGVTEGLLGPGFADKLCVQYENMGVGVTSFWDLDYPNMLRNIPDPPVVIFYKGRLPREGEACVAIVGSRNFSERGREAARKVVRHLVKNQITIVSGLAIGTDSLVHRECLDRGGRTIAVLPCGMDTVYPWRNRFLAMDILEHGGCLMSEYPMKSLINRSNFLERNRLVSGLSRGVIVTEAGERSGSISTPNFAADQGREVWCIKAVRGERNSEGILRLVEDGAVEIGNGVEADIAKYIKQ